MTTLQIDFETRGTVELKRSGVYPYAQHADTDLWLMGWAFDEDEPALWHPGEPLPREIVEHVRAGAEIRAWNAQFERVMWSEVGVRRHGFPRARLEQFFCTAAEAAAMSLPRSLDLCATVLGLAHAKDKQGHALMLRMCRPRKFVNDQPIWWDQPDKVQRLGSYCMQDVRAERAVGKLVNRLGRREREIYLENQRTNDRGIAIDLALATAARALADAEIDRQNAILGEVTGGAVSAVTKVQKLKDWLASQGLEVESLAKKPLAELLSGTDLAPDVRAALDARQAGALSSVKKIDAMLDCVSRDGRARGLLLYHGAGTGREAGKHVQPHNMPRGVLPFEEVERLIPSIQLGAAGVLANHPVGVLPIISSALRSMLVAAPGHDLIAADFAAIEARVLAWLAGDETMLAQFRQSRPIYKEMAGVIFGRSASEIAKPSDEYTLGKNTVLGCGFGMGWRHFMETTGVTEPTARRAVDAYRTTYWRVPELWTAMNEAAILAVEQPGTAQLVDQYGRLKFTRRGGYLWLVLPAGRALAYAAPKVEPRETPWGETRDAVTYCGMNTFTHQWVRMGTYGGFWTENAVQAVARDLMMDALFRTRKAGYPTILTVHDELVTEVPEGFGSLEEYVNLMRQVPRWAEGCPVDAEGWRGKRYRK